MKETVAAEYSSGRIATPHDVDQSLSFAAAVRARSQIVWGEHCSECAYPKCYTACSFYDPRSDLNCRRFAAGIEQVVDETGRAFRRIRFRRWGKLEGRGPALLRPNRKADQRERLDAAVSRSLAKAPLPFALQRNAAWRWNTAKARAPSGPVIAPDAFVVEGWSGDGVEHSFTLTFLQELPTPTMFQTHFKLGARYTRLSVPAPAIAARIDLTLPYLVQIEPVGEADGVDAVFGLTDFVALAPAATAQADRDLIVGDAAPPGEVSPQALAKVLVWDLDETLWTGTLAEDGPDGVQPRPEAVAAIRILDQRGVLQSIASKNDEADAMAALRRHGLDDYFLHPQVNWGPKSQSIARIAGALDLGLDSFVFADDQPFERAEVQAAHPAVRVLTHDEVAGIAAHAWFDHPATPEAAQRRRLYQSEAERKTAYTVADTDYLAFLRNSGLTLQMTPLTQAEAVRVFELSQRTNQLNFTGAKLLQADVEAMVKPDARFDRLVMRCADRFGDYGLIGFVEVALDTAEVTAFFMSCRVQRKRVEHAAFAALAERLRARGHSLLRVRFRATERNGAAVQMLTDLGFEPSPEDQERRVVWTRALELPFQDSDVVRLTAPAPSASKRAA